MAGRESRGAGKASSDRWTGFGFSATFRAAEQTLGEENKENMSDSSGSKEERGAHEASLLLRLDDTIDEEAAARTHSSNGSLETRAGVDDSPAVGTDAGGGECSERPFGRSNSNSRTFDDSVIEIIQDSPVTNKSKSIIDLMDSREDLEMSACRPHDSEILASNSLLYENVDNLEKVIDEDEDVQSMLAHQSMDLSDDMDDSILLFDKSSEMNLLSPRKDVKSKKEAWSPKKEIWSASKIENKKRKLREASLSPAPEESNKKKVGAKEEDESPGGLALDVPSDSSRPGSSQVAAVTSPDISCGSPIPGPPEGARQHDAAARRTSTPGAAARRPGLSTPQKLIRQQQLQELEAPATAAFKTPITPPEQIQIFRILLPDNMPEARREEYMQRLGDLNTEFGAEVLAPEAEEPPHAARRKRVSDASSLSKSSAGGSSGYTGGSSSGAGSGSGGRSRLSIMPDTTIEPHHVIARLPDHNRFSRPGPEQDVTEAKAEEEVVLAGPNVSFVDDADTGVMESQTVVVETKMKNGSEAKKPRAGREEAAKKPRKRMVKKRPLRKVSEEAEGGREEPAAKGEPAAATEVITDRFKAGTKVFAKWVDGTGIYFYPAEVVERVDESTVRVLYTEDAVEKVLATESDVISVHHLGPGDCVTANWDQFQAWEVTASLLQYPKTDGQGEVRYELAIAATESEPQPNEDSRTVRHRDLRLTDTQACAVLRGRGLVPTTNKVSAEINFENLVYSKRRTQTPSARQDSPSTPRRRRGGEHVEESAVSAAEESSTSTDRQLATPGRKAATPGRRGRVLQAATPTSARARRLKGKRIVSTEDEEEEEEEVMPKTSSRMQAVAEAKSQEAKSETKSETKSQETKLQVKSEIKSQEAAASVSSPKPPASRRNRKTKDVFADHSFVLNSSAQKALPMTDGEEDFTDSDQADAGSITPRFDRKRLREMIEAHGGVVLDTFPTQAAPVPTLGTQLMVVSDRRSTTMTYMTALADSVPIVSHLYILDCVASSSLQEHKAYLLPAGFSSLLMREVEQGQDCSHDLRVNDCLLPVRGTRQRREEDVAGERRVLSGLHVLVISRDAAFTEVWQGVLSALGAAVSARHEERARLDKLRLPDVVVTDGQAPRAVCKDLDARTDIPVVSTKWVIQCVVNKARVAYNNFKCKLPAAQ